MRVFTRPVTGRFSRLGYVELLRLTRRVSPPGALAPSLVPVQSCRGTDAPGPSGFDPRRQCSPVRFASQPDAGLRDLPLGHAPVGSACLPGSYVLTRIK